MKRVIALAGLALLVAMTSSASQDPGRDGGSSPDQLLLKDHRPRSIYKIPQTRVEKARFPVIDVHSHPYARTPEQVDQWVRNMDEVGVAKSIVMVGATGKRFDDAVALFQKYPDRFELWCGIDYTGFDQAGFPSVRSRNSSAAHGPAPAAWAS